MSTFSSEDSVTVAGHRAPSSGFCSTLPSDTSDSQMDITPPTSPALCDVETRTPRDILDVSRRLAQISLLLPLDGSNAMPPRPPRYHHHRATSRVIPNDETGYDADGDGDGEGHGMKSSTRGGGASRTATLTRPVRRPAFLRIDTRQHRRVASMLATRRPTSPGPGFAFEDADTGTGTGSKFSTLPSIRRSKPIVGSRSGNRTTKATGKAGNAAAGEYYELRRRPARDPVGLGIGFPENHPLQNRAFSMPVPRSASPTFDFDKPEEKRKEIVARGYGQGWGEERQFEWVSPRLPSVSTQKQTHKERTMQNSVRKPLSPVKMALRPTFLEVSPSPIERLPPWNGGAKTYV